MASAGQFAANHDFMPQSSRGYQTTVIPRVDKGEFMYIAAIARPIQAFGAKHSARYNYVAPARQAGDLTDSDERDITNYGYWDSSTGRYR
jgi:hypothetical protein